MTRSVNELINQLINDGGDCRTAPATPGQLKIAYTPQSLDSNYRSNPWGRGPLSLGRGSSSTPRRPSSSTTSYPHKKALKIPAPGTGVHSEVKNSNTLNRLDIIITQYH